MRRARARERPPGPGLVVVDLRGEKLLPQRLPDARGPAGSHDASGDGVDLFLETLEAAEVVVDGGGELAARTASGFRRHMRRRPIPGAKESSTVEWQNAHWIPTDRSFPRPSRKPVTPTTAFFGETAPAPRRAGAWTKSRIAAARECPSSGGHFLDRIKTLRGRR